MIKTIDVDKLFDEYISDFVYKNIGKVKPEEIENQIPNLYVKFGDEKLAQLDGKSPNEYFKSFSGKELIGCLKEHVKGGVPVSDFLCEALTDIKNESEVLSSLEEGASEEITLYLMNFLTDMGSTKCAKKYLEFILWDYTEPVKELATEYLRDRADAVKEDILCQFEDADVKTKEYLVEILAGASKDDRVFEILINQFITNAKNLSLYANYLAKYGDERALPFLQTAIENEKITYADFEELRFAIEALGGIYDKERDFSFDKSYKKITASRKN